MHKSRWFVSLACALAAATSVFAAVTVQLVPTLIIPVVACAVPLLVPARRRNVALLGSVLLLLLFVVAGGFSVGLWYVPSLLLLIAARFTEMRS